MVTDLIVVEAKLLALQLRRQNEAMGDSDFNLNLNCAPPIPRNEGTRGAAPALIAAILERGASASANQ
jgi:hypothetical protein